MRGAGPLAGPLSRMREAYGPPLLLSAVLLILWQVAADRIQMGHILPGPLQILQRTWELRQSLFFHHLPPTLLTIVCGWALSVSIGVALAMLMHFSAAMEAALHPALVITQTIPTVALAPILILWLGYEMEPKIALVVLTTFFPIAVSLLDGYRSVDDDEIRLLRSIGANRLQVFFTIKFPAALGSFFSGLKISASYAIVGAVISEWIGGFEGLGVYMTRVRKAYAFDKMFAVIIFISVISLVLMGVISIIEKSSMPWKRKAVSRTRRAWMV